MSIKLSFDTAGNIETPTVVLALRSGNKINAIDNVQNFIFQDDMENPSEFSFTVYKSLCSIWEEIKNLRLIWIPEWDKWYELYTDTKEDNAITKNISARHLPEAELSNLRLYNIEINTEADISREDYKEPTYFFNEENPEASLLHRITGKAVNFSFGHIDKSLVDLKRVCVFEFNDISIYDAFNEIAVEYNCHFEFNSYTGDDGSIVREISAYDLESNCLDCGYRGEFNGSCPECGSTNVDYGYGKDTCVFLSIDNALDDVEYTTDIESVKNCFRLEGGDDLMTAAIMACNPNGSQYMWYTKNMEGDMSQGLVEKLNSYDETYNYYYHDYQASISPDDFNEIVSKYQAPPFNHTELESITVPVKGYASLMNAYFNTLDMALFLTSGLMPSVEMIKTSAEGQVDYLHRTIKTVGISGTIITESAATNAVLTMARALIDSRYQVKIADGSVLSGDKKTWSGKYIVTNYSDNEDTYTSTSPVSVSITEDYETFLKDKIEKVLSKNDDSDYSISGLFDLSLDEFKLEIKKYGLTPLQNISNCCESVLSILIEQGVADATTKPDLYENLYVPYYDKSVAIQSEIAEREKEIEIVNTLQEEIEKITQEIQTALDFESYIGETLWKEFSSFRREDKYSNTNYISDGLSNADLFKNANEFISIANKEIIKAATLQHSITTNMKNILVMKEFEPLRDEFSIGNWIRVEVDGKVYKLRLLSYKLDFNDYERYDVTFSDVIRFGNDISDVESVLNSAKGISSSYDSVKRQASKGSDAYVVQNGWSQKGLDATVVKIVNDANNQDIVYDSNGMIFRRYNDITDTYDDEQIKIINSTIAVTTDNWKTIKTALGRYIFTDPETGEETYSYGIIGETIVGKLILGEQLGIYNQSASLTFDENGLMIKNDKNSFSVNPNSSSLLNIKKDNANILSVNSNGDLELTGKITATSGYIGGASGFFIGSSFIRNGNVANATNTTVEGVYVGIDGFNVSGGTVATTSYFTKNAVNIGGKLTWNGSTLGVTGNITTDNLQATGGKIANFTISDGFLFNGISIGSANSCGISCGTSLGGADDWIFWAGNGAFKVNITGKLETKDIVVVDNIYMKTHSDNTEACIARVAGDFYLGNGELVFCEGISTITITPKTLIILGSPSEFYGEATFDGGIAVYGGTTLYGDFQCATIYNTLAESNVANVRVGASGYLRRVSSSSARYKNIISSVSQSDINSLYEIPTYWFKYKDGYLSEKDERSNKEIPGFIVEDWEYIMPIAVDHNEDGSPEMWNSNIVIPLMFEMIKNEHRRNTELMQRILELERKVS